MDGPYNFDNIRYKNTDHIISPHFLPDMLSGSDGEDNGDDEVEVGRLNVDIIGDSLLCGLNEKV